MTEPRAQASAGPGGAGLPGEMLTAARPFDVWVRRLLLPALFGLAVAGAIELAIQWRYHPGFWQRTTWLMHDPYRGEIFDRTILYEKLSNFENSDPQIISVGDSSGFFGLQSTIVNRYTNGVRYLSLNTGANYAYGGYRAVAEYMLRRSPSLKHVVIYVFPQLLPVPEIIRLADLAPIVESNLTGVKSYTTPPSAFLAPYLKYSVFANYRFHFGEAVPNNVYSLQLHHTIRQALGWLPEFDIRIDRIGGQLPFFTDQRNDALGWLGLGEQSKLYETLADFNRMVRSYGATLAVAFAPISTRAINPVEPMITRSELAMERFSRDHPEVKFLFPLISHWSPEKFGTANHISREYTFLSSARLGRALGRLVSDPRSIKPYGPSYEDIRTLPRIDYRVTGADDPELRLGALAFYLYTSTLDPKYRARISRRVLDLLDADPSYRAMIEDKTAQVAMLSAKKIDINFDLSQLRALPIEVTGMTFCNPRPDTQWVFLNGIMQFTYESPAQRAREPVKWPEQSHVFIPTVLEDGVRKFDGYCPEAPSVLGH